MLYKGPLPAKSSLENFAAYTQQAVALVVLIVSELALASQKVNGTTEV